MNNIQLAQKNEKVEKLEGSEIDRQTKSPTRQTDRQTDKITYQTDRQTKSPTRQTDSID